ncbi:hypothetical protein PHYBOEH_008965 [Phytophthora boehmeriae]|uniref:M96 mating-specific protein family n=1 Tax=Phytophthora boehmeriae TaxID=109152 RepID=A0A8T1W0H1_9STRA|nr:hypothetical protein PHYBOEH_008965 [Phytophthora boehmeriae]
MTHEDELHSAIFDLGYPPPSNTLAVLSVAAPSPPDLFSCDVELDGGFEEALQFLETYSADELCDDRPTPENIMTSAATSTSSASDEDDSAEVKFNGRGRKTEAPAKTKRRTRVTTKQQITSLQGTVEGLTKKLESLQSEFSQTYRRPRQMHQGSHESVVSRPLWQKIAARQLELRHQSEEDNAALREMLELQMQEAKNLKRILKRRTRIERMENMLGMKRLKRLASDISIDAVQALETMLHETDEIYARIDQDYAERGMKDVLCPGRSRHVDREVINGVYLEIMEKQLVPFPAKNTERAVWATLGEFGMQSLQCVKDFDAQVHFHAQHSQKTNDTVMTSYSAATSGFQNMHTAHIRKVVRKYVEANRTVFVSQLVSEPKNARGQAGIAQSCKLRVVVQKANDLNCGEGCFTLIQSCVSVSRHAPKDPNYQEVEGNVDMAIAVWDEIVSRMSGVVESYLLDESFELGNLLFNSST